MSEQQAAPATVRVYVDGRGVDAPAAGSALDAVAVADSALAARVGAGERALADSRGLPCAPDAPVHGGMILRVVGARGADA